MSIASQITALTTDRNDIRAALVEQGVLEASSHGFDDFADDIASIISGTGEAVTITETTDTVHGGTILEITGVDLSGDTVRPSVLLSGYTAHNALGESITGTCTSAGVIPSGTLSITSNGTSDVTDYASVSVSVSPILKMGVVRPDAQLVQTYTYNQLINANEGITIPAYSTTAKTLKASVDLSPTITLDCDNYNYYVLERMLTIPSYSVTTKGKGRFEYGIASAAYEIVEVPANNLHTVIDNTKILTTRYVTIASVGNALCALYWSSGSAIAAVATAAYGTVQAVVAPTIASGVLTIKSPNLNIRGSTTYFTNTYFNKLSDIQYQYVIEVYRYPKNSLNYDGLGLSSQMMHIIDCMNTNNKILK